MVYGSSAMANDIYKNGMKSLVQFTRRSVLDNHNRKLKNPPILPLVENLLKTDNYENQNELQSTIKSA